MFNISYNETMLNEEPNYQIDSQEIQNINANNKVVTLQSSEYTYLNIILVGPKSIGKTSFVSSLNSYLTKKFQNSQRLQIKLIDTQGFDQSNSETWFSSIRELIGQKYRSHKKQKEYINQSKALFVQQDQIVKDNRIHLCLYFLSGPRMQNIEMILLSKLSKLVNVIPLIAKCDQYTKQEIKELKELYVQEFKTLNLELYSLNKSPFAVFSSIEPPRRYAWGICDQWNPDHSEFLEMCELITLHQVNDLIRLTDYYQQKYFIQIEQIKSKQHQFYFFKKVIRNVEKILQL